MRKRAQDQSFKGELLFIENELTAPIFQCQEDKGEGRMKKLTILFISAMVLISFMAIGLPNASACDDHEASNPKFMKGHHWKDDLTNINSRFMVKPHEAYLWHLYKDKGGGTYSGSPSWKRYMKFLEWNLEQYGVRDITRNVWTYDRWYTTDWPGHHKWTLTSDGKSIKVASYSAYSGSTTEAGITAPLVYYDPANPPALSSLAGKIVVFKTAPHPCPPNTPVPFIPANLGYILQYTFTDHEFVTNPDTYGALYSRVANEESINGDVWYQLGQIGGAGGTTGFLGILRANGAAGGLIVFDESYDRLAGLYQFGVPVPPTSSCPTLFLDRDAGSQVIDDAKSGKTGTLKLLAKVEPTETYQLIGYLPGKNYGKPEDEMVVLTSHTDGPSISQDNGAFGVLGIVHYFSHIPKSKRPRTLMIYMDNRHYMPGMEGAFAQYDYFTLHPEAKKPVVASVGTEHLGQIEYREIGDVFEPTGRVETSYLWARNNQLLIDMAIEAVQDHEWPRVEVKCVERPGINGKHQGPWYGLGGIARSWNIPGYGTMGTQGAYWATTARIKDFDADLFCTQVATMAQLSGQLMVADLLAIDPLWGTLRTSIAGATNFYGQLPYLPDSAFVDPANAATQRATLVNEVDLIFNNVKAGAYAVAIQGLNTLKGDINTWIKPGTNLTSLNTQIDNAIAKLQAKL